MATNQQLKDYITQQTKLGVSKETMKSALLGAGWNEGDVNQALAEYETESKAAVSPSAAQPVSAAQPSVQPAAQPQTSFSSGAAFSAPSTKPSTPFMTSDIFQPKGEAVFKSSSASQPASAIQKPQSISMSVGGAAKGKVDFLAISLGVLSILLLGGNVYFYFQNNGLRSQVSAPSTSESAVGQQQASQITSLTADNTNLTQQVTDLNKTITDLTNQVSIFAPAATSSITSVAFDVSGTIGGGGKTLYSLTTSKNIVLTVRNSKDTDIDAVLKLLVGKQAELSGTHQPGYTQLTVTAINGQSPKDALTALTAPQAPTSTTPAAAATTTAPSASASTSTPAPAPVAPAATTTATSTL